ncbi:MAG: porin [Sideroxyarcus sp.]|nr:porin [Sideroxyarcus sp.]
MKKVALSLASVLVAATFAPEASAVPSFARQTGMACSACHMQHFPSLNGFGRAFKADGFTMMGAQEKIEGEHLSIPAVLNTSILLKAQYRITNGDATTVATNDGAWKVPDEFGLFFGGRLADTEHLKVGTLIEHDMSTIVGFRIPMVTDIGGLKLSVIPFLTDALGPFYGYTESSTGLNRAVRWNEHHADISAHRYVGMATGSASGLTFMAKADLGYVALTRWTPNFPLSSQSMSLNLVHAAVTTDIAGFDTVLTAEYISGTEKVADYTTVYFTDGAEYKAGGFTAQANGEMAGMESTFYATYAKGGAGAYSSKQAFTVGGDVTVIPHALHLGAAYRNGKDGADVSDNAISLMATYDLAQNLALQATYSMYSGDKYNTAQAAGDSQASFLLESAW